MICFAEKNCDIAQAVAADAKSFDGVRPWAVDQEAAAQLWEETKKQIAAL